MIAAEWRKLVIGELKRSRKRAFMMAAGLTAGVAALVFFLAIGSGVKKHVVEKLVSDLPAEEISVSIPSTDLGPLRLSGSGLFSSKKAIGDKELEQIKNIEIAQGAESIRPVKEVYRRMDAAFPASISGDLFGVSYGSDTAITGVDPGMVSDSVDPLKFKYNPGSELLPVLIPEALLEVYNTAFARAQGLPGMSKSFLIGKKFSIELGASSISGGGAFETLGAEIVGLTNKGTLLGVTVPIEYVIEWNKNYGGKNSDKEYTSLLVRLNDARWVPLVAAKIKDMGLSVSTGTGLAERVSGIVTMLTAGLSAIAATILFVAGLNAFSLFRLTAWERRKIAGLWMALGATPSEVKSLILAEALVIGAISGAAGSVLALVASIATNMAASRAAENLPFFPSALASFSIVHAIVAIAITSAVALIAAYPSANEFVKTEPANILADNR